MNRCAFCGSGLGDLLFHGDEAGVGWWLHRGCDVPESVRRGTEIHMGLAQHYARAGIQATTETLSGETLSGEALGPLSLGVAVEVSVLGWGKMNRDPSGDLLPEGGRNCFTCGHSPPWPTPGCTAMVGDEDVDAGPMAYCDAAELQDGWPTKSEPQCPAWVPRG